MAFLHNKSIDKIRVLVCGDSYVGKSSLVHLICHDKVLSTSPWTIGCKAEVKVGTKERKREAARTGGVRKGARRERGENKEKKGKYKEKRSKDREEGRVKG
jgi:GTPase SAR1 family protein